MVSEIGYLVGAFGLVALIFAAVWLHRAEDLLDDALRARERAQRLTRLAQGTLTDSWRRKALEQRVDDIARGYR